MTLNARTLEELGMGTYCNARQLTEGPYAGNFAHLARMLFTVGVMVSDVEHGHPITRWCYQSFYEAKRALAAWDGVGDPPGEWVKQKPEGRRRVPDPFDGRMA